MKKIGYILVICLLMTWLYPLHGLGQTTDRQFRTIGLRNGLSSSQVNCMLKDSRGYVWLGTMSGLNRFDGIRFKNYYSRTDQPQSLLNDWINRLEEDEDGNIWIETNIGYCVYHPATESFDKNMGEWMAKRGMVDVPSKVLVDSEKNLWIVVNGHGAYVLKKGQHTKFIPIKGQHVFTGICETKQGVAVIDEHGMIVTISSSPSSQHYRVTVNEFLSKNGNSPTKAYNLHVDRHNRYWVSTDGLSMIYCPDLKGVPESKKWFSSVEEWFSSQGIHYEGVRILVMDLIEDDEGSMWIATDHAGLLEVTKEKQVNIYRAEQGKSGALHDNTLRCLMIDDNGALWVGTLKNGAAYTWKRATSFPLLPMGDICTIAEDRLGNIWCGTNDNGIVCYQPLTGSQRVYRKEDTGLGTNVVVCSLQASDGSLWFGTFQGGMARYHDGRFQVYRMKDGLASDNVWALAESNDGHIWIGTLGGGIQELDVASGQMTTYNTTNSELSSNYVSSIFIDNQDNILIGHSQNLSLMNGKTRKITRYEETRSGQSFISSMVNQIIKDSRGLIWSATASGVNVYDPNTDQLMTMEGMACSVAEDLNHHVWIVSDNRLTMVNVIKDEKGWSLDASSFDSLDGLQDRQFNYRSIQVTHDGDILIGGQDGINMVPRNYQQEQQTDSHVLFCGLVLFDHPLAVGEEYNGRVVLKEALNESKRLVLEYSENAFTIQLAASGFVYPSRKKFLYRLVGFSDQWRRTSPWRSDVTYTNLSPGKYQLQVQVLDRYGKPYPDISELEIVIRPPFYLSIWAILSYILLGCALLYYIYYRIMTRQKQKFEIEQMRREAERKREMDEMKMQFYTNASHELRTPLTLIISPLSHMIRKEESEEKRAQLSLVHRNAEKLLTLVNDILDFRKLDAKMVKLNPSMGDIVERISDICQSFRQLQDKPIQLSFESSEKSLLMSYDDEKMTKIMNNLLSNAYKFTDKGEVRVSLSTVEQSSQLQIQVSDTGKGISDEDKQHVFERFYQVRSKEQQPYGGSGVGLNMVKDFVEMHGGTITVADNPGGGSVFTILLPIYKTDEEPVVVPVTDEEATVSQKPQEKAKADLLIVDDSDDFLEFMSGVMMDSYQVRVAHDGEEALTLVKERKPDIILSDVMMPVMDGIELCRAIKGNPETERIPFVLLTARMAQENKIEGMESGADDYITKPFNIDLLTLRMNNLLKWRRSGRTGRLEPQVKEIEITSLDEKLVKDATEFVEKNISDDELSVETLSAELNMSRVHLYKKLLSLTGNTPSEFIRLIRLRRAEQLLRQSQLNVAEISYEVGFNNPRYFSKYFREMYGMTPSQYKEKYKEN